VKIRDLSVLLGVILIIIMLVIPLPGWLLSVLILCNISLALLVILVSMNTQEALQFSIFPSLLLLLTLFRLGLNVSTTRSILSKADAGGVVDTFGSFVIGNNPLVGFVVFIILVIIQYIVITKGAERVAEVSARFTLDAMPGKQMSIDADMNAGLISEVEARERRKKVEQEADFHGSMDGASKFVKGDAIAGIVIVLINIIFGIIIGMVQLDLTFNEAVHTFMRLTVGDGLVSQIPALLIATATGIVVTRVSTEGNLGTDVTNQLLQYPKLLFIAAGTIFLLGFTPINFILTTLIAFFLAGSGFMLLQKMKHVAESDGEETPTSEEATQPDGNVVHLLSMDPIEFEFGYALIPLVDKSQGGDLLDRIIMIRRQLALELGVIIPTVRIRDNIQLEPNQYKLSIKGNEIAKGELLPDHMLAMTANIQDDTIEGISTQEPAFGLPAKWIAAEAKEDAEIAGYTVVDPPSVISTHLTEVLKRQAHILLGRQETKELIDHLQKEYPILVEEVTPNPLSIGEVQKVLTKLLKENISIRNLPVIFETLADFAKLTNDADLLTEYVRQSLAAQITKQYSSEEKILVITTSTEVENMISSHIEHTEHGHYLALAPQSQEAIIQSVQREIEKTQVTGSSVVVLCSPTIRMYVKQLIERTLPQLAVLSYNELEASVQVKSVGVVNVT
jgi:flagellar biosynthesis protein FlhA